MCIFLGETADGRGIISGAQIIISGFGIQVFAAVAEGVGVEGVRVLFVAECVVVVFLVDRAVEVGGGDNVAVGVEEVVFGFIGSFPADEVDASEVAIGDGVALNLCYDVSAVQEEGSSVDLLRVLPLWS